MGFVAGVSGCQWYQLSKWDQPRARQWVDVQVGKFPKMLAIGANGEGYNYSNLMQGIYFANKFALVQGKTFNVPTLSWV